jgi:uncharacterized membrane protein
VENAKLLGAVGVLCFILAGSYLIKLGIAEGWITPKIQLIALVAFAQVLIFAGFILHDRDVQYASFLPASGIVLMYMASYSGHFYFHLYDTSAASIAVNVVSVVALVIYSNFRQHIYALVASAGTYLLPLLLDYGRAWDLFSLFLYFMAWNVTFSIISVMLGSRVLMGLTAYLAVLMVGLLEPSPIQADTHQALVSLALFQAIQMAFFCTAVTWYSIKRREPLLKDEAWSFFPLLLLFYLFEYRQIDTLYSGIAPWCAVGFAFFMLTLYGFAKNVFGARTLESFSMLACLLAVIAVQAVYMELSPNFLKPCLAIALLFYYGHHVRNSALRTQHSTTILILSFVPFIEYVNTIFPHQPEVSAGYEILISFAFASALLFASREAKKTLSSISFLLAFLGAAQFLLGLKRSCDLWFEPITAACATSALWSATALGLLFVGQRSGDRSLSGKANWLFALTAVKVLLFDLSESGASGRIVALLIIGALFYTGGYVHRQIGVRNSP